MTKLGSNANRVKNVLTCNEERKSNAIEVSLRI